MTEMLKVVKAADIDSVAALAAEIWIKHYVPIIGKPQVDYMLRKFQSPEAIAAQIADGHLYYMVIDRGQQAGYFAFVRRPETSNSHLSKIYVKQEQRGQGFGRAIVTFVEKRCAALGIRELWLTVNRHNADAIAFYTHLGFVRAGTLVTDIGDGFVMDDYKMAKRVSPCAARREQR